MIRHQALDRFQEVVAVNRSDLESIREFDGATTGFGGVGTFLFGGGLWLGIDKFSDWDNGPFPVILVVCVAICVVGLVFLGVGAYFASKKRSCIDRIFNETKPAARA